MRTVFLCCLAFTPWFLCAHTVDSSGLTLDKEALRQHLADEFMAQRLALAKPDYQTPQPMLLKKPTRVAASVFSLSMLAQGSTLAAPGSGELLSASFLPFKPKLRFYNDANYFYVESDGIPDRTRQPNLMVGISSWQQQVPMPASYFIGTTNGTGNPSSTGYQQPNVWKIPLVPVPAASPLSLSGNFLRGAVALGSDGVPIFNPRNNTGQFSYAIGELDSYGGHCGLADDYHYHLFPTHLTAVLGNTKPIAWALDGYPVYGYLEPDGSAQQTLDAEGGHDHGPWGYHYHARGTYSAGVWTPASPYMMSAMHGTVVNLDSQIDPQPSVSNMRASGTGGYTAQPVPGAVITAFKNPVALSIDGSGHLIENPGGTPSEDDWLMRYTVSSVSYDVCWRLNRTANPRSFTITWRHPSTGTTTTTYSSNGNRITAYPMAGPSQLKLPDTGQVIDSTATYGEDSDYLLNLPSFTNNGNGTITDNVTGLMWQGTDNGECTWENAQANGASVSTGGHMDWRLPTPSELFSLFNHQQANPALSTAYFPNHPAGAAEYWWSSDLYGTSTTSVWCGNAGGGLGPKPKSETISAGGTLRYHARYVRGASPTNSHNYANNNDGTVTDLDTGLMWQQVPGSAMTWANALSYAEGLTLGGFSDWRLPNVKELQTLTDYTLATYTSTTGIKPSLHRLLFPSASAAAYWSSTSQNNNTANAWVVEFGITSTSSPARNAQGIISQDAKTASYPVFVVRTATLTSTQIAVSLNGAALGDGISIVDWGAVNVGTAVTKMFVIGNNGSSALSLAGISIDGSGSSSFSVIAWPAVTLAAGASTSFTVQFAPTSASTQTAALHIASNDASVGSEFDFSLAGTGLVAPPSIAGIRTSPNTPTYADAVAISAQITPANGVSMSSAQLTYSTGTQSTSTVFAETMTSVATSGTGGWDGTGAVFPWTVASTAGAGNIKQATIANHGTGGTCGVQFDKGSSSASATMIQTTNMIDARGTAGYVEFWLGTTNLSSGLGWTFQVSTDNADWVTRLTETDGSNHAMQLYHYDLTASERVSSLRLRFQFIGNGTGGPTGPKTYLDDITLVATSGLPPVVVPLKDDGLLGDALAGDGTYTAMIPQQMAGTTLSYSLAATDSTGGTTTSSTLSYVVSGVTPPASFQASSTISAGHVMLTWPAQSGINYSVQWSTDLIHWLDLPVGQTGTWTDTSTAGVPRRFYRVSR